MEAHDRESSKPELRHDRWTSKTTQQGPTFETPNNHKDLPTQGTYSITRQNGGRGYGSLADPIVESTQKKKGCLESIWAFCSIQEARGPEQLPKSNGHRKTEKRRGKTRGSSLEEKLYKLLYPRKRESMWGEEHTFRGSSLQNWGGEKKEKHAQNAECKIFL